MAKSVLGLILERLDTIIELLVKEKQKKGNKNVKRNK